MKIPSKCENCGAPLDDIPENKEYITCKYCESIIQVRDKSDIDKGAIDKPAKLPTSPPPQPPPTYTPPPSKPRHSTVLYWVIFFLMPPLWAIIVLRDKAMDQYLKVIAWLVLAGTALWCLGTLVPACIAVLGNF
jgi:DNA-directed RNA polymerase subunit RPC12/RpoP